MCSRRTIEAVSASSSTEICRRISSTTRVLPYATAPRMPCDWWTDQFGTSVTSSCSLDDRAEPAAAVLGAEHAQPAGTRSRTESARHTCAFGQGEAQAVGLTDQRVSRNHGTLEW